MGQDQVFPYKHLSLLHQACSIGDNHEPVTIKTNLTNKGDLEEHCKAGLLLVNMIRCNHMAGQSMNKNDYYGAWFGYTLKLAKHCC